MSQTLAKHLPPKDSAPAIELPEGVMRLHLMAWLPQGIVGPKMTTFVTDQEARVLEVDKDHIRLQLGRKSWLPGKSDEDFAMELSISLNHQTICARSATHLIAEMRPLVRGLPLDVLTRRFGRVARSLRYCLLAQELEGDESAAAN